MCIRDSYYSDFAEKGYYNRIIAGNINPVLKVDSVVCCLLYTSNPDATQAEREKAAKVFTDMEGTELDEKMMEGSSEIGIRIKGLIEIRRCV